MTMEESRSSLPAKVIKIQLSPRTELGCIFACLYNLDYPMKATDSFADRPPPLQAKQCSSSQPAVGSASGPPSDIGLAHSNENVRKPSPAQFDAGHQGVFGWCNNSPAASQSLQAYHMEYKKDRTDFTISGPFAGRSFQTFNFPNSSPTRSASQDIDSLLRKEKGFTAKARLENLAPSNSTQAPSLNIDRDTRGSHGGIEHQCKASTPYPPASAPTSALPIDLTLNDLAKSSSRNYGNSQSSGTETTTYVQDNGRLAPYQPQSISLGYSAPRVSQNIRTLQRNASIAFPIKILDSYTFKDIKVNSKANVELHDGDFMRIVDILQDTTTLKVSLRGWIFRRTRQMNGLLERKVNELCWIMHIDEDDSRDPTIQAMVTVPITSVKGRRKIRMTNKSFPAYSFREDDCQEDERTVIQERVLVCRFKYICLYMNAQARERYVWSEKALHRLRARECDPSLAEDDNLLRYQWRGDTEKGGAKKILPTETQQQRRSIPSLVSDMKQMCTPSQADSEEVIEVGPASPKLQASRRKRKRESSYIKTRTKSNSSNRPKSNVDFATNVATSGLAISDALHQSILKSLTHHETRSSSPEIMDIDLRIKTITKTGTLERRYESRVTSAFTLHSSQTAHNANESRLEDSGLPPKRSRNNHSHAPEISVLRGLNENSGRSLSRASSESTIRASPPPPPVGDLEQPANRISDPHIEPSREQQLSTNNNSCYSNSMALTPVHGGSSTSLAKVQSPVPNLPMTSGGQRRVKLQRYTFGDCFCGGGGMARGALKAGLSVRWGFDFNQHACETYKMNFPEAEIYNRWAHEIPSLAECFKVDICHLSPPCQFFSPAHTVMGKDDEMNTASLFAITELLKKAKPRVVTLEQTSGLISGHELYFNAVVQILVTLGFSIRWRVMNCADFGVPQRRLRIFMIASW